MSAKYTSIPSEDEHISSVVVHRPGSIRHIIVLTAAYSFLAAWTVWNFFYSKGLSPRKEGLYSPLEHVHEYELVNFNVDTENRNIYMGSNTPERVDAWHFLTRKGPSKVTASEASKLYETTEEWMGEPGTYVVGVEMYHQLHCLDTLRYAIWDENPYLFHGKDGMKDPHVDHMMHCIEYLRLSLMCLGDTTVIPMIKDGPWYLDKYSGTRMCRKYKPIEKWMEEHSVLDTPQFKEFVGSVITGPSNTSVLLGPDIVE